MKVSELIEMLQRRCNPDAEVIVYNADCKDLFPVSGILYNNRTVELFADGYE